jgi:hypothetical protein
MGRLERRPRNRPFAWPASRGRFSIRLASGPCTAIDQTGRCTTPPYPCAVTDGADRHYPNPGSQLAADKGGFVGYDLGDTSLGLPMKALSGTQYHDVMSYCDYQWISAYTYMGLLDRLRAESALPPR